MDSTQTAAGHHQRLQELFLVAARTIDTERSTVLDAACAGDPALRREIDRLLGADRAEGERASTSNKSEAAEGSGAVAVADCTSISVTFQNLPLFDESIDLLGVLLSVPSADPEANVGAGIQKAVIRGTACGGRIRLD